MGFSPRGNLLPFRKESPAAESRALTWLTRQGYAALKPYPFKAIQTRKHDS